MASISSISSTLSSGFSGLQEFKLQQAKGNAERAEQNARSLQAAAQDARLQADQAVSYARSVSSQADSAQAEAGQARQDLAVTEATARTQTQSTSGADQTAEAAKTAELAAAIHKAASPVINAAGQLTGIVVNTTA
jgi:hypothetical protein